MTKKSNQIKIGSISFIHIHFFFLESCKKFPRIWFSYKFKMTLIYCLYIWCIHKMYVISQVRKTFYRQNIIITITIDETTVFVVYLVCFSWYFFLFCLSGVLHHEIIISRESIYICLLLWYISSIYFLWNEKLCYMWSNLT